MRFARLAGLSGIGFVLLLLGGNLVLVSAGFPNPSDAVGFDEIAAVHADESDALRLTSALLPTAWLLATIFAAGVFAALWRHDRVRGEGWAMVGLAGILMQCVAFTSVGASRLAVATAAPHDPGAVAGLWGLHNALFGFNQIFLATALLGLSVSGRRAGLGTRWHAAVGVLGAALLFLAATTSPYGTDGVNPLSLFGLVGWLLWLIWIVAYSLLLIRGADRPAQGHAVAGGLSPHPVSH
ncbi:hypothetical protein [Plantactinospora sp. KLBMP9567]|uniref:hypothetical protein n=1 Tax=Plantactinospora sp. KLBMP9567 TaxID=3085900 RepID=UPI002981A0C0|nr:hypothetical protein [Plantactinospora sp. KLBMP9567]MDW5326307.1 hypothetical protein [Plantactinospora sp. KLBMP9567]